MNRNPPIGIACLVVLVGPPGSGKSTWAQRNGRGAIHVSQDGLIDAISPDGFEHACRPIYAAAEDAVARAALQERPHRNRGSHESDPRAPAALVGDRAGGGLSGRRNGYRQHDGSQRVDRGPYRSRSGVGNRARYRRG